MTELKHFEELTVNCWVRFESFGDYGVVESPNVFSIDYQDESGFIFSVQDSQENSFEVSVNTAVGEGEWIMATLVYDQNELRGYVNGGSPGTESTADLPLYNGDLGIRFGLFPGPGQEVRFYDYALTDDEVHYLYDVVDTPGTLVSSRKNIR